MAEKAQGTYRQRQQQHDSGSGEKSPSKGLFAEIADFLGTLFRLPFRMVVRYFRHELTEALKNDLRIYLLLLVVAGLVMLFGVVMWFTVAVLAGVWAWEHGFSLTLSVLISLGFQAGVILLTLLFGWLLARRRRTGKLLRDLREAARQEES